MASRCSVVIPTYNRAELLRRTLDSLVAQTVAPADIEVLVVDDGSSDHTAEVAAGYTDRLNLRYFFQPDEGWRVAQARNVGIAHATGEVCVMVDTGVLLHSRALAAHLRSHEESDAPVAVCGYVFGFDCPAAEVEELTRILDAHDLDDGLERIHRSGRWTDTREPFYANHGDDFDQLPAPWVFYWTCNVSAPTDLVRTVGGFDEYFRSWGGEDIDLGYRLFLNGARFVLNRAASSVHYPHPKKPGDLNYQARGNYRYMAQKYPTPVGRLLASMGGALHCYNINSLITARGLPDCREYLREHAG